MAQTITDTELREQCDEIVQALERGESFVLTRNGTVIAELVPRSQLRFAATERLQAAMRGLPRVDYKRMRAEIDEILDQDPSPRA